MPTIKLTNSGFTSDDIPKSPKGHFQINASDKEVGFTLGTPWNGPDSVTLHLSQNLFKQSTVTVNSTETRQVALKDPLSGSGSIKYDAPNDPGLETMQGQIDVVPKGGGAEE